MAASRAFWVVPAAMLAMGLTISTATSGKVSAKQVSFAVLALCLVVGVILLGSTLGGMRPLFSFWERDVLYRESFGYILDHPWTGAGFGHESNRHWHETVSSLKWIPHSHNLLLGYGSQLGFPGIVLILWIFWSLGRAFWPHLRHAHMEVRWLAMLGVVLVVAIFLLNMPNVYLVRHNAVLFFAHVGLLLGLVHSRTSPVQRTASVPADLPTEDAQPDPYRT